MNRSMFLEKLIFLTILLHTFDICLALSLSNYLKLRERSIVSEKHSYFGANLELDNDETAANECLMSKKFNEINKGLRNASVFWPSRNFLQVREEIERSEVFKIIRLMPKAASLHTHSGAAVSLDFLVTNLTYMPNLYVCENGTNLLFQFFVTPSKNCKWNLLEDVRVKDPSTDTKIREYLSLPTIDSTPEKNSALMWQKLKQKFRAYSGLISYRPAFEKYIYQVLEELYDDNILYMELRFRFYYLYDLDGSTYDQLEVIQIFKQTVNKFVEDHPDFLGAKLIYSPSKSSTREEFDKEMKTFSQMKSAFPDLLIGFDLVGQEGNNNLILNFADQLLELGKETTFYFHAGETNWFGHSVDENLFDAVLLNSKRIGHGFALLKHPKIMEMIKEKDIAIELSPISNQVLGYISDMRNHPASYYFAQNFNVVVSNDDPSFWGASGLSYDFYEAYMGIMSRYADLRTLKQLAINSIVYSGLDDTERQKALDIWTKSWLKFVKHIAYQYNCGNRTFRTVNL